MLGPCRSVLDPCGPFAGPPGTSPSNLRGLVLAAAARHEGSRARTGQSGAPVKARGRPKNTTSFSEMFFGHCSDTLSTRGNTVATTRSCENYHNSSKQTSENPEKLLYQIGTRARTILARSRPGSILDLAVAGELGTVRAPRSAVAGSREPRGLVPPGLRGASGQTSPEAPPAFVGGGDLVTAMKPIGMNMKNNLVGQLVGQLDGPIR